MYYESKNIKVKEVYTMSIADCKWGHIIGIVIGTAFLVFALKIAREAFIDIGWEQHVPYVMGAVVASIIGGVIVGLRYSETKWFRAIDSFIKKWGVIAGAVLVLVAILITVFVQGV